MQMIHTPGKPRRNKLHTDQVIKALSLYLSASSQTRWHFGNTEAFVDSNDDFIVTLYGKPILKIACKDKEVKRISVYDGGFYDKYGNPSDLTRERLNGVLDALGHAEIIPQNVRVYYDRDESLCYLIRFDEKTVLNRDYCTKITMASDPEKFIVIDRKIVSAAGREN